MPDFAHTCSLTPEIPSKSVQVTIPKSWAKDIDRVVRSPRFPYRNRAEVLRHAIYLLHLQVSGRPGVERLLQDFEEWEQWYQSFSARLWPVIRSHLARGKPGIKYARRFVRRIQENLRLVSDDFWRERCLQHLDRCYGYLMCADTQTDQEDSEG